MKQARPIDRPPVTIPITRCPKCGSANVKGYKTQRERGKPGTIDAGVVVWAMRHTKCKNCSYRFIELSE